MTSNAQSKGNVFVSASSSGIGFGIAQKFWKHGYTAVLNGRDSKRLRHAEQLLGNQRVLSCCADASEQGQLKDIRSFVKNNVGVLDALICNLGSGSGPKPGTEGPEDWNSALRTNLLGTVGLISALQDCFSEDGGTIICISSICGIDYIPGAPVPYSVAKSALNHFVKCSANPFGEQKIRINAVVPGNILHPGSVWSRKIVEDPNAVKDMLRDNVALGKLGNVEDVANLVYYLASPDGAFITGQSLVVDGGQVR